MNAKIDFDTSKNLSKFLSDKLKEHPGTTQPAKLLHWMAEFQGFRNARTLQEAPVSPTIENGSYIDLKPGEGCAVGPRQVGLDVETRIFEMVFAFVLKYIGDLRESVRVKLLLSNDSIVETMYHGKWGTIQRFADPTDEDEARLLLASLSNQTREGLIHSVTARGKYSGPVQLVDFLFEEAFKHVLLTFLRDLNTTCEQEVCTLDALTDYYELRSRLKKIVEARVPSWLGLNRLLHRGSHDFPNLSLSIKND